MLTEKYEFDTHAINTLLKEFVKRKFGANPDKVVVNYNFDREVKSMTVICKDRVENDIPDGQVITSMATGERKLDIGQL